MNYARESMKLWKKKETKVQEENPMGNRQQELEEMVRGLKVKESCLDDTLLLVNDLLQFMTNLDYVKEMVSDAKEQKEMVATVAASGEELTASTEEISNYVQESTHKIENTMTESKECIDQVEETFEVLEKNIKEIDVAKEIILKVQEETQKINDMVTVIRSVADQTNLLSLNASIEAARAGEHGKGFAVVAEEIKKLSENTNEQVESIQSIVAHLNENIGVAAKEMEQIVSSFSNSRGSIEKATSGMGHITDMMAGIHGNISSISGNVEEQSATTEEISATLQVISEQSFRLGGEADKTGKAFFDISMKVDEARIKAFNCNENIDTASMIEISITDHLMWKWRVYNMIMGYITLDVSTVGDHHGCRLGKWIDSLESQDPKVNSIIQQMEEPHAKIHTCAKTAIEEYTKGNLSAAEAKLAEIEANSKVVVALLQDLKKVL